MIPIFPLIIVIAAYLRSAGLADIIIVLGALGWSYGARQLRVQVLSLRNRDFLKAASVRGERSRYIIVAEILPTLTSLIVATFLGSAVFAVLTAAGLQFVGLGDPNAQSWGTMLYWAQNNEALGAGHAAVGDHAGRLHRPARRGLRLLELRLRRDLQPGPAAGAPPGPHARRRSAAGARADGAARRPRRPRRRREGCTSTSAPRGGARAAAPTAARGPRALGRLRHRRRRRSSPSTTSISTSTRASSSPWWASPGAGNRPSCSPSRSCWSSPRASPAGAWSSAAARWRQMSDKQLRHVRWREFSVVMQSAMNALNPVMTIGQQMRDACKAHSAMSKEEIAERSSGSPAPRLDRPCPPRQLPAPALRRDAPAVP